MPHIGNHVDAIFLPESVNTSTTLRINGGDLHLDDSKKILLGNSNNLEIHFDGSDSYVSDVGTGALIISSNNITFKNQGKDENYMIVGGSDNNVRLHSNNNVKLSTNDSGISVTGNVDLPDDGKLLLGTDDDFQIYYDGGTAHIDNNQGQIRMRAASSFLFYYEGNSGVEDYAKFKQNGEVELYHDGNLAFETTSTGIDVPLGTITGPATLNIDPAAVGDNTGTVIIKGDLQVDGTTTTINSTTLTVDDKNIVLASGAANSAAADGAGITIDGANESLTWVDTNKSFKLSTRLAIGNGTSQSATLRLLKDMGGENVTTYYGFLNNGLVQPDVTGTAYYSLVQVRTDGNNGTGYTISNVEGYSASVGSGTVNADTTITNLIGFSVKNTWIEGTKNYGFRGQIPSGTNRWNVYMDGTAPNYFAGKVGINESNPGTDLHVVGDSLFLSSTGNATLNIVSTNNQTNAGNKIAFFAANRFDTDEEMAYIQPLLTGNSGGAGNVQTGHLTFGTSGAERIRITNDGNVGIGTNSPLGKLHLSDTDHPLVIDDNSSNVDQGIVFTTAGSSAYKAAIRLTPGGSDKGFRFHTGGYTNSEERVRITSEGSVGIGTQQPGTKLEIAGTGSPTIRIKDLDGTSQFGQIVSNAGLLIIESRNNNSDGQIVFRGRDNTDTNEYGRFDEVGRFGVGIENPNSNLHVKGGSESTDNLLLTLQSNGVANDGSLSTGLRLINSTSNTSIHGADIRAIRTGTSTADLTFSLYNGSTPQDERLRITSGGKVGIGTADPLGTLHIESTSPVFRMTDSNAATNAKHWDIKSNSQNLLRIQAINDNGTSGGGNLFDFQRSGNAINDFLGMAGGNYWFTINNNNQNVGIGTTTPEAKLHVDGGDLYVNSLDGSEVDIKLGIHATHSNFGVIKNVRASDSQNYLSFNIHQSSGLYEALQLHYDEGVYVRGNGSYDTTAYTGNVAHVLFGDQERSFADIVVESESASSRLGAFVFKTKGSVGPMPQERLRITSGGNVQLKTANAQLEWQAASGGNNPFIRSIGTDQEALEFNTGGSPRVRIGSGGNVGIGTDDPAEKLHVHDGDVIIGQTSGANTGNRNYVKFGRTSGPKAAIGFLNNLSNGRGSLIFMNSNANGGAAFTDAEEVMRVDSSGNLGIGTNAPNTKLDVFGPIKSSPVAYGMNQDGTYLIAGSTSWSGATSNWGAYGFQHKIKSNAGGTSRITVDTVNGEAFCVLNNNNIGIGTNNPLGTVHISSGTSGDCELILESDTDNNEEHDNPRIIFKQDGGLEESAIEQLNNELTLSNSVASNGGIAFKTGTNSPYTNATERLRITSAGQIGVGTSTVARGPLHIHQGTTGDTQIHMTNSETGTSSSDGFTIFQGAGSSGEDCGLVNRELNGRIRFLMAEAGMDGNPVVSDKMILTAVGNLGIKTTTPERSLHVNGVGYFTSRVGIGTTDHSSYQLSVRNITGPTTTSGVLVDCHDWSTNASEYGLNVDIDSANRTNLTANRTHRGISFDVRVRVAQNASNTSGTRQSVYGMSGSAYVDDTDNNDGKMYYVWGNYARGRVDGVNCANLRGAYNLAQVGDNATGQARTVDSAFGSYNYVVNDGNQTTITNAYGVYANVNQDDTGGSMTNAYGVYSKLDRDAGTGGVGYLFRGDFDGTWGTKRGIWLTGDNENSMDGTLSISGSKTFRIPHPIPELAETKDLVHVCIEAPAHDLIYRGKSELVNGSATINLDTKFGMTEGTFVALNRNVQCFTSNESDWSAVRGSVSGNILTIECQDSSSTATISWMVVGERQDDRVKASVATDADGNLILEPDKRPEDPKPEKSETPD